MAESYYITIFTESELQMEEWRSIPEYECHYKVSDLGRVQNSNGLILQPYKHSKGYLIVKLSKQGIKKSFKVHRLVLVAFTGICPDGYGTNHKDGCKTNNRFLNLEYATPKQNTQHAREMGLLATGMRAGAHTMPWRRAYGDRSGAYTHPERVARGEQISKKITNKQAAEIRLKYATDDAATMTGLADEYGFTNSGTIYSLLSGKTWKHVARQDNLQEIIDKKRWNAQSLSTAKRNRERAIIKN